MKKFALCMFGPSTKDQSILGLSQDTIQREQENVVSHSTFNVNRNTIGWRNRSLLLPWKYHASLPALQSEHAL